MAICVHAATSESEGEGEGEGRAVPFYAVGPAKEIEGFLFQVGMCGASRELGEGGSIAEMRGKGRWGAGETTTRR